MNHELPVFLQELLAAPPRAGAGVHNWLFRVARHLHAHLPGGEIVQLLEARVAGCGRPVPRAEIVKAVQGSLPCMWQPGGNHPGAVATPPPARWPRVNDETRADIVREGYGLADLWERSYPRLEDSETHTEAILSVPRGRLSFRFEITGNSDMSSPIHSAVPPGLMNTNNKPGVKTPGYCLVVPLGLLSAPNNWGPASRWRWFPFPRLRRGNGNETKKQTAFEGEDVRLWALTCSHRQGTT